MASRLSLDEKLAAIRAMRDGPPSVTDATELRRYVGDRSNLVVAAAAALAGERAFTELAADLETAFDRFLIDPLKNDKLCRAKIAVVQALDKIEHLKRDVFEKAARHVQLEPVSAERKTPRRGCVAPPSLRLRGSEDQTIIRCSSTRSPIPRRTCGWPRSRRWHTWARKPRGCCFVSRPGWAMSEADVISECLSGLMTLDPEENLDFVCEFLDPMDPDRCEAAALALGKTRLPGALEALKACWRRSYEPALGSRCCWPSP